MPLPYEIVCGEIRRPNGFEAFIKDESDNLTLSPVLSELKSFEFPRDVTKIGNWFFEDCINLASITIPDSVKSIGDDAFKDCNSLVSVTIPRRFESTFKQYRSIKKINYSD